MKYTFIYIILFFFQNLIINAQSNNKNNIGKVTYERVLNFENTLESKLFIMYFDENFSVFYEERADSDENVTLKSNNDDDDFDLSFDVKFNGSKYIVLTDFKIDTIQSQVSLFKEGKQRTFVLEEKILKINWNLIEEFKTISGFKAQKAVGLFRGRKYIAWFTYEIPIKYGPWKLNGLPGLILSVSDDKNEVNFYVKSISFPFNSTSTKSEYEFDSSYERISLTNYSILKKQQVEEVQKLFNTKLPRGAKMKMTEIKSNEIELEYEKTNKD